MSQVSKNFFSNILKQEALPLSPGLVVSLYSLEVTTGRGVIAREKGLTMINNRCPQQVEFQQLRQLSAKAWPQNALTTKYFPHLPTGDNQLVGSGTWPHDPEKNMRISSSAQPAGSQWDCPQWIGKYVQPINANMDWKLKSHSDWKRNHPETSQALVISGCSSPQIQLLQSYHQHRIPNEAVGIRYHPPCLNHRLVMLQSA